MSKLRRGAAMVGVVAALVVGCSGDGSGRGALSGPLAGGERRTLVFNGEGNRLNAYDADSGEKQTVIPSASDPEPGDGREQRDINAQICFAVDSASGAPHFIAGEDTGQDAEGSAGWGWFQLEGARLGELRATQVGKLAPTYQPTSPFFGPENYGCGFLSDGRLVTTDVGDQFPGFPGTGQLIVWFPDDYPDHGGRISYRRGYRVEEGVPFGDVRYCKIDVGLATAGGILVTRDDEGEDVVYAASARPGTSVEPWGIFRYRGRFPTSDDAAGGCGRRDATGAPLVDEGLVEKSVLIPAGPLSLTPSAIAPSGRGTFYVSSVFDGNVAEYGGSGDFIRHVVAPPLGPPLALPLGQISPTGTPFGIGVDSRGALYYTDIGVLTAQPVRPGSVFRVEFDEAGNPAPPVALDGGLDFPDGIGVLEIIGG